MEFLGFNKKRHGISMGDQEKMVMVLSHFCSHLHVHRVRVIRAMVKVSAAFFHDDSSVTKGGGMKVQ